KGRPCCSLLTHIFSVQCYGALGGTVSLQLMDDFSQIKKNEEVADTKYMVVIYRGKDQKYSHEMQNRSSFFPSNGTVLIHNLSRTDSGECTLTSYNSDGLQLSTQTIDLCVQGKCFFHF
uniref:Immunoglobulin V-set domain-containing protein n=1 Tax=Oryzias latipes TaxID=8090 RepID=A0A3P9M8Y9_ORYLA